MGETREDTWFDEARQLRDRIAAVIEKHDKAEPAVNELHGVLREASHLLHCVENGTASRWLKKARG